MSTGGEELKVKFVLDNSQAKQATRESVEGIASIDKQAGRSAQAMQSALGQQAAAQKMVDDARTQGHVRARDEQGKFIKGIRQVGDAGAESFAKMNLGLATMQAGLNKALQIAGAFGQAMKEAAERYRELTGNFTSDRDKLGELANVMGEKPDNAFTLKNAAFNKKAGFKFDEGIAFRTAFNNAGQQHKGNKISEPEFAQLEEQSAALGVAKGYKAEDVGDFAGTVAGFKDRRGMGDKASEDALGKINSGTAILQAGKGDTSTLIGQTNKVASSALNDDEMKGTFQDSDEVATVVSIMAEKSDKEAATMTFAAERGLRDFNGKAAGLLSKAGIDAKTKFIDAIKKLAPVVEKMAKERGVKVNDILRENFEDIQTVEGIGVQINKGVFAGGYDQREGVAAANQGGDAALKVIDDAGKTERVQKRKADAGGKLAEAQVGAENTRLELLRTDAVAELTKEKKLGTTGMKFGKAVAGLTGGLIADPEEMAIKAKQAEILARRAAAAGVKLSDKALDPNATAEQSNAYYNSQIDKIEKAGGSGTTDLTREQLDEQKKTNQLLAELLKRQGEADKRAVGVGVKDPIMLPAKLAGPIR